MLLFFQAVSGLRINISKSEIIPVGEVGDVNSLASFFGCIVASLPSSYLGLPIGAPSRCATLWNPVIERYERRLVGWKKQYLSKAGCLVDKEYSFNMPTYFMSLFMLPALVRNWLEKMERDFLWEANLEIRKYHLVRWGKVCNVVEEVDLVSEFSNYLM